LPPPGYPKLVTGLVISKQAKYVACGVWRKYINKKFIAFQRYEESTGASRDSVFANVQLTFVSWQFFSHPQILLQIGGKVFI